MFAAINRWIERRRTIRLRWQADARVLVGADEVNAYYEAQRRAARARIDGERAAFYHWATVAAEVARIAPRADIELVQAVVANATRPEDFRAAGEPLPAREAPPRPSPDATRHKRRVAWPRPCPPCSQRPPGARP